MAILIAPDSTEGISFAFAPARLPLNLAVAELSLGDLLIAHGEPREALPPYREAARLTAEISGKMAGNAGARAEMAYCLGVVGKTLVAMSQKEDARAKLTAARAIWQELQKSSPLTAQQKASLEDIEKALSQVVTLLPLIVGAVQIFSRSLLPS